MLARLKPPSRLTLLASVVLAVIAVVVRVLYGAANPPHWGFGLLLISYVILLGGYLFEGFRSEAGG
jgi:hypothetical protein